MLPRMQSNRNSLSFIAGGNVKWHSHFGSSLLNILLPYDPAIARLGIYPKELKTYVHTKTCTQMFTEVLFIIAETWTQPRCASVNE